MVRKGYVLEMCQIQPEDVLTSEDVGEIADEVIAYDDDRKFDAVEDARYRIERGGDNVCAVVTAVRVLRPDFDRHAIEGYNYVKGNPVFSAAKFSGEIVFDVLI